MYILPVVLQHFMLGLDYSSRVLYNDYQVGRYVSVILTLESGRQQVIDALVYSVSEDGILALILDFSRLYTFVQGMDTIMSQRKQRELLYQIQLLYGRLILF